MEFEFDQRLISSYKHSDDAEGEPGIRPLFLDQYIGQTKVKDNMNIFIEAAKLRSEALDHVLLYGSPGLGKTTLANIIANELGVHIHITSGPALEQPKDLLPIITKFMPNSVLFIDEIHRLNRTVEEMLYPVMEDFKYDYIMGKGPSASIINISLPRFTLIGATTRAGMLSSPLRNRFGVICRLEYYTVEELIQIVERAGRLLKILIDYDGAVEVARRSRGTPRIANRLLRRLRDIAQVRGKGVITKELAVEGLELLDIDQQGLDRVDIKVMEAIIYKFGGGPVGLETIAATISESADTIEDVCEPYLLQLGFLNRTPRGRQASPEAYRYFNLQPPGNLAGQGDIFS